MPTSQNSSSSASPLAPGIPDIPDSKDARAGRRAPRCVAVVPARYGASRFPGKPLAEILGKPMFAHVCTRAAACPEIESVCLATDDERIRQAAEAHQVACVLTRGDHASGTDRVCEAVAGLGLADDDVVVNVQGDEPALAPAMLSELVAPFFAGDGASVRVATLARRIDAGTAASPDVVKVVVDTNGDALYFSRSPVPYPRDEAALATGCGGYLGHVGLYAFRYEALKTFTALTPTRLERTEKLEQLRLLENAIPIRVALTTHVCHGVDRPEDIALVTELMRNES